VVPEELANVVFVAGKMATPSAMELEAVTRLYGFKLSPIEINTIFKIKRTQAHGKHSNSSSDRG